VSEYVGGGEYTIYVGDALRWTRDNAQRDERIALVPAPDGTVLEVLLSAADVAPSYRLNLTDYQGSPRVVVANASIAKMSFDAWGAGTQALGSVVGYTGHEPDLAIGLTNMGGRIYDQTLGRFITPDPIMKLTGYSQHLNRYAYVLNSPQSRRCDDSALSSRKSCRVRRACKDRQVRRRADLLVTGRRMRGASCSSCRVARRSKGQLSHAGSALASPSVGGDVRALRGTEEGRGRHCVVGKKVTS
jgi:RHS repeat-associated protein